MFVELSGEVFKVLKKEADGNWLISYENPSSPIFVTEQEMNRMNRIEPPAEYQKNCMQTERTKRNGGQRFGRLRSVSIARLRESVLCILRAWPGVP